MRVVGLEEHLVTPAVLAAQGALGPAERDLAFGPSTLGAQRRRLLDLGDERLAAMDATGLDVQVLSLTTPGLQNLPADVAVPLQRDTNDLVAGAVAAHPDRFRGLAALATADPEAAAAELRRAVGRLGLDGAMLFGRSGSRHLDHPDFAPLFEAAESLHAPLHLHPQSPPPAVREAYYSGFGTQVDTIFATFGVGWHLDAGVEFLRMVLGGVFDRHPDLQVVLGHWGELVLFFLERIQDLADVAQLPRPLVDYARTNLHVAPSGVLSERYLRWALEVVGPERLLFSTDYPFTPASREGARAFLESVDLDAGDRDRIASGNWERLTAAIVREEPPVCRVP